MRLDFGGLDNVHISMDEENAGQLLVVFDSCIEGEGVIDPFKNPVPSVDIDSVIIFNILPFGKLSDDMHGWEFTVSYFDCEDDECEAIISLERHKEDELDDEYWTCQVYFPDTTISIGVDLDSQYMERATNSVNNSTSTVTDRSLN